MENKARYLLNNILNKPFDEEKHSRYDFLTILEILIALKMNGKHSTYSLSRSLSSLSHVALITKYLSVCLQLGLVEYDHVKKWYGKYDQAKYYRLSKKGEELLDLFLKERKDHMLTVSKP
ncbi:MAG: hypothetical protein QXD82_02670 [Nitrososphaerales archaeon]